MLTAGPRFLRSLLAARRALRARGATYAALFACTVVVLLAGAVSTFRAIGASTLRAIAADSAAAALTAWPGDSADLVRPDVPVAPSSAEYARFAEEDRLWRVRNARVMTLEELRARGDGRRTPREAMLDRTYRHRRAGQPAQALAQLEQWVAAHPRDEDALLSLARMLREAGRTDDALRRYRQALGLHGEDLAR